MHDRPRSDPAQLAAEKNDHVGDVLRQSYATQRNHPQITLECLVSQWDAINMHQAGDKDVDANALWPQLALVVACDHSLRVLKGGIGRTHYRGTPQPTCHAGNDGDGGITMIESRWRLGLACGDRQVGHANVDECY